MKRYTVVLVCYVEAEDEVRAFEEAYIQVADDEPDLAMIQESPTG